MELALTLTLHRSHRTIRGIPIQRRSALASQRSTRSPFLADIPKLRKGQPILVTTAGKVGAEASRMLAQRGAPVRVLVLNPEKVTDYAAAFSPPFGAR